MLIWPQISMIILLVLGLGINLANHGKIETTKNSFWTSAISAIIVISVLYAGGFWNVLLK